MICCILFMPWKVVNKCTAFKRNFSSTMCNTKLFMFILIMPFALRKKSFIIAKLVCLRLQLKRICHE